MTSPPLIELQDICYSYQQQADPILSRVNFSIGKDRAGLIGPNGCGKTTLFHIIMGLITPTSGVLLHRGRSVTCDDDFIPLRKVVGFLFQSSDDQLFSPTVIEDVAFGPLNLGYSQEDAREKATQTLNRLGLHGFENRITHKLSGGEKKLVALATILSMDPKVLLLDEPTNNLDADTRERLIYILNTLPLPFVIISHDWDFLAETTSIQYTLEGGHLHRCSEGHIHEHRHIHPYGNRPHHHND